MTEDGAGPGPVLQIIVASTRPGRAGWPVSQWVHQRAVEDGRFDVELVDLAELALPFMDEPRHPRLHEYAHPHTLAWSAQVERADAFIFVTPEYNHGFNAPLKNAIDYLHREWNYKPVGFVSYGGVAAGTRAVQMLKTVVVALRMVPVVDAVAIPFVAQLIDEERRFQPTEALEQSAAGMLNELHRMAQALRPLRVPAPEESRSR